MVADDRIPFSVVQRLELVMSRFLLQVNRDGGYANITQNSLYENSVWSKRTQDKDHGEVKSGDELIVYCTSNVPEHGMSLAFSTLVSQVSEDSVTFELEEPRWFASPLKYPQIHELVDSQELPEVFRKCGHQGFNITKLQPSEAEQLLELVGPLHTPEENSMQTLSEQLLLPGCS